MKFEKKYTEYWKENIINPIDGLKIADLDEVMHFLPLLNIEKKNNILDLGCSYGRMFNILNKFSDNVFGIDPDNFAVENAIKEGYIKVKVGNAEKIDFSDNFFDKIFCWAVYDVVDHFSGLMEANRVLKKNGRMLITGKNDNYFEEDKFAFTAEKNAFLKSFPNHFLDMNLLVKNIGSLGFKIEKLFMFPKRGDFGKLNYVVTDHKSSMFKAYEYLLVLEKIKDIKDLTYIKFDNQYSKTAINIAINDGYASVNEYFKKIGID
jgi:SAM-dependent methyltransferase